MKLHISIIAIIFGLLLLGCEDDHPGSLFDPDDRGGEPPVISEVDPPDGSLAAIGIVRVMGENFSPVPHENMVYIGKKDGKVLEASESELKVQAPNELGDSLKLRVSVAGALDFSNPVMYSLEPAVEPHPSIDENLTPWSSTTDGEGNLYVSLSRGGQSEGIQKITPDGEVSEYVPPRILRYDGMKMGPGGYMYLCRNIHLIARVPPGGGQEENWLPFTPGDRIVDMDFDEYGNLWAVGNNDVIFRVDTEEGEYVEFPFDARSRSVRYYDGYLYISAITEANGSERSDIWRMPVDGSGEPGEAEVYFNFSNVYDYTEGTAYAITFSAAGELFIGTDGEPGIILVSPDKEWEPFYEEVMTPRGMYFSWGEGPYMYYTRGSTDDYEQELHIIHTQRESAPYYGIQ